MATLKIVDWVWQQCDNCKNPIMLPVFDPSTEIPKKLDRLFCPFCGGLQPIILGSDKTNLKESCNEGGEAK